MRNLARRSIVASKRIKKGEKIDFRNLCFKRPGNGMPPSQIYKIMGYKAKTSINKDRLITKKFIFRVDRNSHRIMTKQAALYMLWRLLK